MGNIFSSALVFFSGFTAWFARTFQLGNTINNVSHYFQGVTLVGWFEIGAALAIIIFVIYGIEISFCGLYLRTGRQNAQQLDPVDLFDNMEQYRLDLEDFRDELADLDGFVRSIARRRYFAEVGGKEIEIKAKQE